MPQRVSAALVALAAGSAPLGALRLELLGLPTAALLAAAVLNRSLYAFFCGMAGTASPPSPSPSISSITSAAT